MAFLNSTMIQLCQQPHQHSNYCRIGLTWSHVDPPIDQSHISWRRG